MPPTLAPPKVAVSRGMASTPPSAGLRERRVAPAPPRPKPRSAKGKPASDAYHDRADVLGARLTRPFGWPIRRPRYQMLATPDEEIAGPPAGVTDMASSATNFVPGPTFRHLPGAANVHGAARQTARVPTSGKQTHSAALPAVTLSLLGIGLLVFGTYESVQDFRIARSALKQQRADRRDLHKTFRKLANEPPPSLVQQGLLRQAQSLMLDNRRQRREQICRLVFPGVVGTVGTVVGGLGFLFYGNLLGALWPSISVAAMPLLYVAAPLTCMFTAVEGGLKLRDYTHAVHLGRSAKWLLRHRVVGNEEEVHALLHMRLKRVRFWSAASGASYIGAAVGGPLSFVAPQVGLGLLVASAVGILISDNMLQWRVGYDPQLSLQERLNYASPHSLANASYEAHHLYITLKKLRQARGRGYGTGLSAHHGVRWHVARAWQHCFGPTRQPSSPRALALVMARFCQAELQRGLAEQKVLSHMVYQAQGDARTLAFIHEHRAKLHEWVANIQRDLQDLTAHPHPNAEAAVFRLLSFMVRYDLFKSLAMEILHDKPLCHALNGLGVFTPNPKMRELDANEIVLALCKPNKKLSQSRDGVVGRLFALAEHVLLTDGRRHMRSRSRQLVDMLAERLLVESKAKFRAGQVDATHPLCVASHHGQTRPSQKAPCSP